MPIISPLPVQKDRPYWQRFISKNVQSNEKVKTKVIPKVNSKVDTKANLNSPASNEKVNTKVNPKLDTKVNSKVDANMNTKVNTKGILNTPVYNDVSGKEKSSPSTSPLIGGSSPVNAVSKDGPKGSGKR